ncbi:MAG: DUF3833 family protein [Luteimonas sp.]
MAAAQVPVEFTPSAGFEGESEGRGTLKFVFRRPRAFQVTSHGTEQGDGTFRLDQTITFAGEPPQSRFWVMTRTAAHRYAATLSDAAGPVDATVAGPRLSLRYRVKGPVFMHQELVLSADGRTIDNVGVVRLLGIPIGRLQETITRKVPASNSDDPVDRAGNGVSRRTVRFIAHSLTP